MTSQQPLNTSRTAVEYSEPVIPQEKQTAVEKYLIVTTHDSEGKGQTSFWENLSDNEVPWEWATTTRYKIEELI